MTQEEYRKALVESRATWRDKENRKYMQEYVHGINVGDYVYVRCDGPGPCVGRVAKIDDISISILKDTSTGYIPEYVWIEGGYLRANVTKVDSYADVLSAKIKEHKLYALKVGMQVSVILSPSRGEKQTYDGVIRKLFMDSMVIMTEKGEICVHFLTIEGLYY